MSWSNVIVGLMVAVVWLVALSSGLRNWRAITFLVSVSGLLVVAGWLPSAAAPWTRALIWGGAILVLLFRGYLFSAMLPDERVFVQKYLDGRRRLSQLKARALQTPSAEYVRDFERIIDHFGGLAPPLGQWASLRAETVAELERRLTMMRLSTDPNPKALEAADANWAAIERRFDLLLRSRTRSAAK